MPPTRKTSLEKKLANATVTPDEVYKYLTIDKGLSHEHAMGILPNIVEESEFIYNRIQNDAKYDPDHSKGRQGIGLFQYTEPTRRKNFVETVPDWQTNWKGQIDFALSEPETKKYLNQGFDTIEDASRYFTTDWERPKNRYRQAEKRLDYVPGLISQIEAQNTKPYASETFQSYVMPPVNVIEKDPMKEYIDLDSDDIINDLALAGQQMNYFAQGGARNANNMKRYYATGGVNPSLINEIVGNEGFSSIVYKDSSGTPTIGYGYTKYSLTGKNGIPSWKEYWKADGTPIKEMSREKADEIREAIVQERVNTVNNNLSPEIIESLSQDQYNSIVDLVYRNGAGNVEESGLWKILNDGDFAGAAELITTSPELRKAGGKVLEKGDEGYNGIVARNNKAASTFDKNQGGINPVTDNIARELGLPTSQDLNDELFGGFESAEAQAAAEAAYYANTDQQGIINAIDAVTQNPEDFQTQGTPEDEARWYAENTNQEGIINQLANDFAASQAANQLNTPYEPTAEDYARLGINSNAIARQLADDYESDVDFPMRKPNMLEEDAIARDAAIQSERNDYTPITQEEIDATIRDRALDEFIEKEVRPYQPPTTRMAKPKGNYNNPDIDYRKYTTTSESPADPVDRNFLSKLKGQDYMGLLTDIGAYAARMAPLGRALRDASSYDEERYPRFAPIVPTATLPKRDVRDAFATAQQAALQQGKLDLGALSALATQQAKETARVEENVANERAGLLNQAQQLNNQITMQEMADTAANKGAAQTMKYQVLAAMSEMGQGSLREANMRRNDAIVKEMFESVFDELKDIKSNRA